MVCGRPYNIDAMGIIMRGGGEMGFPVPMRKRRAKYECRYGCDAFLYPSHFVLPMLSLSCLSFRLSG